MIFQTDMHTFEWINLESKSKIGLEKSCHWGVEHDCLLYHVLSLLMLKKSHWLFWNPEFTNPNCLDLNLSWNLIMSGVGLFVLQHKCTELKQAYAQWTRFWHDCWRFKTHFCGAISQKLHVFWLDHQNHLQCPQKRTYSLMDHLKSSCLVLSKYILNLWLLTKALVGKGHCTRSFQPGISIALRDLSLLLTSVQLSGLAAVFNNM